MFTAVFVHILTATLVMDYGTKTSCPKFGMQLNVKVGIDFQKSELMTNACDTAHCSQVQYLMPSPS